MPLSSPGSVADSAVTFSDITTNDSSTTKHGFLRKLDGSSSHFLDGTGAWATPAGGSSGISYETRSSNTILGTSDQGKFIDITAAITQTFTAAATLGAGWWIDLRNNTTDGSTVVTLDPNSTETIDGATTLHMWSGEVRRVICTGSAFVTIMLAQGLGLYAQYTGGALGSLSTAEATPTDLVSLGAQTYDAVPILIQGFWTADMAGDSSSLVIGCLWDTDSTELCRFGDSRSGIDPASPSLKLTPSAGSHTYKIRVFGTAGSAVDADSGSGGSGTYPPAYIRATKI